MYKKFLLLIFFLIKAFPKLFWIFRINKNNKNYLNLFFFNILKKEIKNNINSVAELGCTNGILIEMLNKEFPNTQFHGFDISILNISIAKKKKLLNTNFFLKDMLKVDLNNYDMIIAQASLIYLNKKEISLFFKRLFSSKVLRCVFLELGSNDNQVRGGHFYAHPYEKILEKYKDDSLNLNFEIKKLNDINWYKDNSLITPRLIKIDRYK